MGKKRALPTTQVINLFNGLTETEKAMVFDYIRSQAKSAPKSSPTARRAGKQSLAKSGGTGGIPPIETGAGVVSTASAGGD